jgi:hypothetical protein
MKILVFICMVMAGMARGATYYIDFDSGIDTQTGTSTTTAWKHCPGDTNATGTPAAATLTAGDTVCFKGGVEYHGSLVLEWSGAAGDPLVYNGNAAGTWGTGRAILDGEGLRYVTAMVSAPRTVTGKYITIHNFILQDYRNTGFALSKSNAITIRNCKIWDLWDWEMAHCTEDTVDGCGAMYIHGHGCALSINDCEDVLADNIEITRVSHNGISIKGVSNNIEIKNCDLHDYIHWQLDISPSTNKVLSNLYIHDNVFRNVYHYSSYYWTSTEDEKVNPGTGSNPHQDGIFIRNPTGGTMTNIRIYNNSFYTDQVLMDVGSTALLYVSELRRTNGVDDDIHIYNNTFQYMYAYDAVMLGFLYYGKIYVYNNTFHMQGRNALRITCGTDTALTEIHLRNNIFNMESGTPIRVGNSRTMQCLDSDHNLFCLGPGSRAATIVTPYTVYDSLAQWRSAGQDLHSISVGNAGLIDPRTIPEASLSNLGLLAGSPAINVGASLDGPYALARNGVVRPAGSGWDVGAYEYTANQVRTSRRNAQVLNSNQFNCPNPIQAALLIRYLQAKKATLVCDLAGNVVRANDLIAGGIYLVQTTKNEWLQKLLVTP